MSVAIFFSIEAIGTSAAIPHRIVIPDIDGYKTLKGELHIHTVFSDASVWPTTRIDEAMTEGLDFIAITDHVDARLLKQKNKGLMDFDRNESYKIAASAGKSHDVLVIHGSSQSEMIDLVLDERLRELCFEGKRWFDLVRVAIRDDGKYKSKLVKLLLQNVAAKDRPLYEAKLQNTYGYFLPINESDMVASGGVLVQNPYYL